MGLSSLFDIARNLYGGLSYSSNSGKALIPLRYFLELTYRCNLECPYCYVGAQRKKNELSTQEWFNIIEQLPPYAFVTLVGGEVTLRKDFLEIFEKVSNKTFGKVNIVSNGILLTEDLIDNFVKNKLLLLSVSLDGYGKQHDMNRNKEGIFDTIISNLESFNSKRNNLISRVDIKTIILENNLDDIPRLYKLCLDMNFDFFSIAFKRNNMLKQCGSLKENWGEEFYLQNYPIEQYFDMAHFEEIYKELQSLAKGAKTKIRWAPKFAPDADVEQIKRFFLLNNEPVSKIYEPCVFPWSNVFITPEGDMYPCLSLKIGNIKDKKLVDVYNEPKFRCFRKNLKASKLFNSCQLCCELTPKNL